jgi:hypothetical protein
MSVISASVVRRSEAIDAPFCSAIRSTLVHGALQPRLLHDLAEAMEKNPEDDLRARITSTLASRLGSFHAVRDDLGGASGVLTRRRRLSP